MTKTWTLSNFDERRGDHNMDHIINNKKNYESFLNILKHSDEINFIKLCIVLLSINIRTSEQRKRSEQNRALKLQNLNTVVK